MRHIAIIMDGNGRWAEARGLERIEGHKAGARSVGKVVEECARRGIPYLTLFSFSTENWKRDTKEVGSLMDIFKHYLDSELSTILENNICLKAIGNLDRLPLAVRTALKRNIEASKNNTALTLVLALSYGAREEILKATQAIASKVASGKLKVDAVDEKTFARHLWTDGIPDPDLLIRTSGEMRISNFLLWQLAYTEIVVAPELWPDFDENALGRAIYEYEHRERRFGLTGAQLRSGVKAESS